MPLQAQYQPLRLGHGREADGRGGVVCAEEPTPPLEDILERCRARLDLALKLDVDIGVDETHVTPQPLLRAANGYLVDGYPLVADIEGCPIAVDDAHGADDLSSAELDPGLARGEQPLVQVVVENGVEPPQILLRELDGDLVHYGVADGVGVA